MLQNLIFPILVTHFSSLYFYIDTHDQVLKCPQWQINSGIGRGFMGQLIAAHFANCLNV